MIFTTSRTIFYSTSEIKIPIIHLEKNLIMPKNIGLGLLQLIVDCLSVPENEIDWQKLVDESNAMLRRECVFLFLRRPDGWKLFANGTTSGLELPDDFTIEKTEVLDSFPGCDRLSPALLTPVIISDEVVAIFGAGGKSNFSEEFVEDDQLLLTLLVKIASSLIEKGNALAFLEQRFIERSVEIRKSLKAAGAKNEKEEIEKLMVEKIQRPFDVVALLARSFYKELHKGGFSTTQILHAAKEIIKECTKDDLKL